MIDLAIIGAGPYGLSLAAHAQAAGLDFRIFGKTMESWKHKMPAGMFLKSQAWASCLYHPSGKLTLEEYCRRHGVEYHDTLMEIPLELFCRYGEAFRDGCGLQVADKKAVNISTVPGGCFRVVFDDGEVVSARRVVLAVGLHAFSYVPEALAALPPDFVSHSGEYGPIDPLRGREVVIVGSGASAINLAVLLHEQGVAATLLARDTELRFIPTPRVGTSRLRRMASGVGLGWLLTLLRQAAGPDSGIGGGWDLWFYANAPELVRQLPGVVRRHIVRNALGPLGGYSMKARMLGKVPAELGWQIKGADVVGGRVRLNLRGRRGAERSLMADHVVAATGYRVDLQRLSFLDPSLRQRIRVAGFGAPVLSKDYETSVPGLHVIGTASADSFGPVARFVYGAKYPARRLARRFAADATFQPEVVQIERKLAVGGV